MVKPLFNFLNAEDKLLLEIGGGDFIKHSNKISTILKFRKK